MTKVPHFNWSGQRDSNPRMMAWEAIALPLGYARVATLSKQDKFGESLLALANLADGRTTIRTSTFDHRTTVLGGDLDRVLDLLLGLALHAVTFNCHKRNTSGVVCSMRLLQDLW